MTKKEVLLNIMKENEYIRCLGIELQVLEKGYGKARMPYREALTNSYGMLHGGSLYSFADIVAGIVACMGGQYAMTVSGSMNFMAPAINTEYVYCEVKEVKQGEKLAVLDVRITADDGRILDNGSFTFFRTGKEVEGE
ncbi:MAG: PaaI family thioesterase [Lachnospiraceae bacterium]